MTYQKYYRLRLRGQKGFTLVELAIVLMIIGILMGSVIGSLSSRIETTRYQETKKELDEIKSALIAYAFTVAGGPYLPCPDTTGNGESEANCSGLAFPPTNAGEIPWVTLGLGASDAWNNRYEYWVDDNFSPPAAAFSLATTSTGQVKTRSAGGATLELLADNVVAVIHSKGKNSLSALGVDGSVKVTIPATGHADELENNDGNIIFVSRAPTPEDATTGGGAFDDIVTWISSFELKAKMVEAGVLP